MSDTKTVSPLRQRMIEDMAARKLREEEAYRAGAPAARALVDVGGVRSYVAVALRTATGSSA